MRGDYVVLINMLETK